MGREGDPHEAGAEGELQHDWRVRRQDRWCHADRALEQRVSGWGWELVQVTRLGVAISPEPFSVPFALGVLEVAARWASLAVLGTQRGLDVLAAERSYEVEVFCRVPPLASPGAPTGFHCLELLNAAAPLSFSRAHLEHTRVKKKK